MGIRYVKLSDDDRSFVERAAAETLTGMALGRLAAIKSVGVADPADAALLERAVANQAAAS